MAADERAIGRPETIDGRTGTDESFRETINRIPAFVCTLTDTGAIEFVNDQVLAYFGRTLDELRNWPASDAVHRDDLPNVIATLQISIDTGEPSEVELRLRRADGVYRWFLLRRVPHCDRDGPFCSTTRSAIL
jgi:PAS domain S-box-containing protein